LANPAKTENITKMGKWLNRTLAALVALAVCCASCERAGKYNVLLITMDTTRADHLRCYGYQNIETPALNSLARQGVLFNNAYVVAPMTLPAHTAILSGTRPLYNGVVDNGGYRVPDELVLLPEILKPKGYATAGFISAAVLKKVFNINQGFDYWDEEGIQPQKEMTALVAERKADATTDAVLAWLNKNYKKKWMLWVHYYDPHQEWNPPQPYLRLYYFDRYAGEIAFLDSQIKRLLEFLDQKKLASKTIVVAIADHGEGLGEHGEATHGIFIYDATARIPFIIRIPGLKNPGRKISQVVSQLDVLPTILDLLSMPAAKELQGRSLKNLLLGQEPDSESGEAFLESHFPLLHYGWSEIYGLRSGEYKYFQVPKPELYDLKKDPGETKNIASANAKLVKELDYKLEEVKKSSRSAIAVLAKRGPELDEQTRKQLEALGYVQGAVNVDLEKARKKNPADYADLLGTLASMQNDHVGGHYKVMLTKADQVLKRDPQNLLALRLKEDAYFGLGQYNQAINWINQVMSTIGENGEYYFLLGTCYLRMEKIGQAQKALEKAIKLDPQRKLAAYYLSRIYLKNGQPELALKTIDDAKLRDSWSGHLFMATYYQTQPGRQGKVEAEYELALEQAPKNAIVKSEYAQYLLQIGRPKKVLELLEEAEKTDPSLKTDPKVQQFKEQAKKLMEKGT